MPVSSTRDEIGAALGSRFASRNTDTTVTVLGAGSDDLDEGRAWLEALAEGGWAVPTWPSEYGGRGMAPGDVGEISRLLSRYAQPDLYPYLVGLHVVAPTLLTVASGEQCARWLPPIQRGAEIWCQLFSEPGAGSDLANVSTHAVRDSESWMLSGQKVWSSRAHYARWGFCLARTDVDVSKHAGITAFAVDMRADGVDVRPLKQMNGDAHFSEVFLSDVIVPDADRIADVGAGWSVARTVLANERGAVGAVSTGLGMPSTRLLDLARRAPHAAARRDRLMRVHVDAEVARLTTRRARDRARRGTPGPEGSGAKLRGSAGLKDAAGAALSILGPEGMLESGEWQTVFLMSPSISIRGGTDEIQRNIVGERVLGLPPEPRVDTDRPYREIPR